MIAYLHVYLDKALSIVQVGIEERVSLRTTGILKQFFAQNLATDGILGLSINLLSKVQHLDLTGVSIKIGQSKDSKNGILLVNLSLMMSCFLWDHILIEQCLVCLQVVL